MVCDSTQGTVPDGDVVAGAELVEHVPCGLVGRRADPGPGERLFEAGWDRPEGGKDDVEGVAAQVLLDQSGVGLWGDDRRVAVSLTQQQIQLACTQHVHAFGGGHLEHLGLERGIADGEPAQRRHHEVPEGRGEAPHADEPGGALAESVGLSLRLGESKRHVVRAR